jgi:hypothetical protein
VHVLEACYAAARRSCGHTCCHGRGTDTNVTPATPENMHHIEHPLRKNELFE